jgi:hypothetical protein
MNRKIDWVSFKAAVRTAGALMLGNVAVGVLLLEKSNMMNLTALFIIGLGVTIAASFQKGD